MSVEYYNHSNYPSLGDLCSDIKNRLRVYTDERGKKRYHCYKCGQNGFFNKQVVTSTKPRVVDNKPVTGEPIPLAKRVWLYKYGITDREIELYNILYCKEEDAIVLQVYDEQGLALQQLRYLKKSSIKYKTITCRKDLTYKPMFIPKSRARTLVLTEDILSAIKVSREDGVVGVALMGTSMSPAQAMRLTQLGVEEAYLYLDNDNKIVKRNQVKIKKLLDNYLNCDTTILRMDKDPKELTKQEIKLCLQR